MSLAKLFKRVCTTDAHAQRALLRPDVRLTTALSNSSKAGLPAIQVPALAGQYLLTQCQLIKAKDVLEIGTLGGYSTLWFAKSGARVTSIEIDAAHRDVALKNVADFSDKVEIVLGAALEVLPRLHAEGARYDLVFLDASWEEQVQYFEWATKLVRPGGCVYVDNVVQALPDEGELDGGEGLLTYIGKMENVTATLVQTARGENWRRSADGMIDGFVLAVVDHSSA